jgi:hypothetical protein
VVAIGGEQYILLAINYNRLCKFIVHTG